MGTSVAVTATNSQSLPPVVVCVADDLSGANVTASLLRDAGLAPVYVLADEGYARLPPGTQACVVNTGTRDSDEAAAAERFRKLVRRLKGELADRLILWSKRIDSTLRGHIALELAALREELAASLALFAPAFPEAGRTTVGGYQLVGAQLAGEAYGSSRSLLAALAREAGFASVELLPLHLLRAGSDVANLLPKLPRQTALIADAMTNADLQRLAEGTVSLWLKGALAVDSGPYTGALAAAGIRRGLWEAAFFPVLAIIGARSPLTQKQLEHLAQAHPDLVRLDPAFSAEEAREAARAAVILLSPRDDRDIPRSLDELGAATERLLSYLESSPALLISGGWTASKVLSRLGFEELEAYGELLPLVPLARIRGGRLDGWLLATKGGLVGDETALTRAVSLLRLVRRSL